MGHMVQYLTKDANVSKQLVLAEANHISSREGDYENQIQNIRWIGEVICDNEDDAYDYIEKHDKGWYDNLAVRYYEIPKTAFKKSKKLESLEQKLKDLNNRLWAIERVDYTSTLTSTEYVGCKKCGSKISTKFFHGTYCPVCRNDLRPKSTLDKIANLKAKIADTEAAVKAETKVLQEKQKSKAVVKWLVKIEFHC